MRRWPVALALAAAACTADREAATAPPFGAASTTVSASAPITAPSIRSVAIIGDSITNGSEVQLRERLGSLDIEIMAVDAEDGRRMTTDGSNGSGLSAVSRLAARGGPDLWVIALGTNDIQQYDADGYGVVIDELLAAVPADAPLVWVDVYLDSNPDSSADFNDALRAALGARGHATVVDWASLAAEDGVLRDGIHPSGFGIERFAERVTAAVSDWMN